MPEDRADITSSNLLMRWTLIWISAVASVKAKDVCPFAFIDKISEVICQHGSCSSGNLRSSTVDWLIIDLCSNRLSLGHSCLWMPNESFSPVLPQQPNPINEWEWVTSSADVNLSLCHLSQIVCWWGPGDGDWGQGHSQRPAALSLYYGEKHNNQNSSEYKSWLSNLISKLIPLHDPLRQMHNMILWVLSLQIFQMLYHCWWYRDIFNHQCLLIHPFCFELWLYTYKTCHLILWAWAHLRWTEAQWENKNSMIKQNVHF